MMVFMKYLKLGVVVTGCIVSAAFMLFHYTNVQADTNQEPMESQRRQVKPADSLVDSIGIHGQFEKYKTAHSNWDDQPNVDVYKDYLKPRLIELGIRHIRRFYKSTPEIDERIRDMHKKGLCFNFILDQRRNRTPVSQLVDQVASFGDAVESIEGPNEWDEGQTFDEWHPQLVAYCKDLYQAFRHDPRTAKIKILGPTLTGHTKGKLNFEAETDPLSDYVDYGSIHMYDPPVDHPRLTYWARAYKYRVSTYPHRPIIESETGYPTSKVKGGVSEIVQSKYILRKIFENFNAGIVKTYTYDMIDLANNPDDNESNYGLLRHDGTPKPAFIAERNLIRILNDQGKDFQIKPLDYTIKAESSDIRSTLLQKRNGEYWLALWLRVESHDTDIIRTVNLKLPKRYKVELYDPQIDTKSVKKLGNGSDFSVDVPDRIILLRIKD